MSRAEHAQTNSRLPESRVSILSDSMHHVVESINNKLPSYFQSLPIKSDHEVHNHNTRYHDNIHIRRTNHEFAKMCIRHNIPNLINSTDQIIKEQSQTHSLQGFTTYVKNIFVQSYQQSCFIKNCYICRRENI